MAENAIESPEVKKPELPWLCPDHPEANVRHLWDQSYCVLNGYPAGTGIQSNHRYECAVCCRELASKDREKGS